MDPRRDRKKSGECPRPVIKLGQYYATRPSRSPIRCKGYTHPPIPPFEGTAVIQFGPIKYLGPVQAFLHTHEFASIQVAKDPPNEHEFIWVNVWKANSDRDGQRSQDLGTDFAWVIYEGQAGSQRASRAIDWLNFPRGGGPEPTDAKAEDPEVARGGGVEEVYIGTPRETPLVLRRWMPLSLVGVHPLNRPPPASHAHAPLEESSAPAGPWSKTKWTASRPTVTNPSPSRP